MAKLKRKEIRKVVENYVDLEISVEEAIEMFNGFLKTYANYKELFIELDYDSYNGNVYKLIGKREETDEEYEKSLKEKELEKEKEKEQKKLNEEKEFKEYLRLREKYE